MTTSSSKKIGRPVGSKNKLKRGRPAKTFKQADEDKSRFSYNVPNLLVQISDLEHIRKKLHLLIDNFEYKEIQYKAVISYLENKLENK